MDPIVWNGGYVLAVFGLAGFDRGRRLLSSLTSALDLFDLPEEAVRSIFVTIDPQHDTPIAMMRFLRPHYPRVTGITGDAGEVRSLLRSCISAPDGGVEREHDLSHCDFTYVIDPRGRAIERWPSTMEMEEIVHRLGRLL